jgi:hypothetical protein
MARTFVLMAVLTVGLTSYAQPPLIVQPSTIPGISIIGPESPGFAATVSQIVGTDQPSNFTAWSPYSVVVKNTTPQALAGIMVAWTTAREASAPLGHGGGLRIQWFNQPARQIQPGQSVVALPLDVLMNARDLKPFAQGRGMGNLPNFQEMQRNGVSVDGVVFASGQFVGDDAYQEYEEFQAEINAPRSVATAVLEKKTTSPIPDILSWLQMLAAQPRGGDFTAARSASAARGMLAVYSRRGEAALYSMAQDILQQPVFPLRR